LNSTLKSSVYILLIISVILVLNGYSYADSYVGGKPLDTLQNGTVTGDVNVDSYYGFTDPEGVGNNTGGNANITYTFNYTIPSNAQIKNATLYVLVYSGHMQEARQTYVNVTYNGNSLENQTLYTTYIYPPEGNNNTWLLGEGHDNDPYLMINNHTMRVTSDYLLWYDVTNMTKKDMNNTANVCTIGSYDGRIKLITLIVAYNIPGSTTATRYWINWGHDVSSYNDEDYTGETYFNGAVPNPANASVMIVHAASSDGIYTYNDQNLPNGTYQRRGSYSGYEIWNVTNIYNNGTNKFTYHKSPGTGLGGYYKIILAVQKVTYTPNIDLTLQTVTFNGGAAFVLENNTMRCQIKNNGSGASPATILALYANDELVATSIIPPINPSGTVYVNITDPTIRSATTETLYSNNNQNVTYRFVIDPYNEVPETNEANNEKTRTVPVLYNGYKGKRWAYNGSDINTVETYYGRYGLAYYAQPDTTYRAGTEGWSNYTVIFNGTQLSIPENATPVKVYLYVPYNWDNKGTNPADGAATTYLTIHFNNATFQPGNYTRWYWDQSNFGGYPHYKYGLLVYDVTEYYLKNQDNAVFVNLTVPASQQTHTLSMFPFTLLVIYNDTSRPPTGIYINEEYDILLLDPNFSVQPEECIAYVNFPGIPDVEKVSNATYMTWVTHAGPNEGNVYFNNETLGLNVWQGNSKTSYPEIFNVTGKLNSTENRARIQGTSSGGMGAILQILMLEYVESLAANFTASPTMGVAPLTVQFTDLSTEATEWYWDFNNDTIIDSREQNPTYTYTQPGTYTVTLTVKGPGGENTLTKENCITVAKVMNLDTNRTFDRIQDAINDNSTVAGHTILVGEGNYTENIVLNKPLTLKANGLVNIIASTSTGTVIDVKANDTRIEGFTIQGANGTNGKGINIDTQYRCTLINNTVINNYYGIYIKDSEGCQLHNNRLQDNLLNFGVFDTVSTDGSKFNQEIDTSNTINGNPVYYLKNVQNRTINETVGFLAIINGTNVTIKDITVSNNSQGILIVTSSDCTIQNTTILNNRHGIYLWNSTGITIKTSTITNTQANAIIAYKQNNNLIIENNTIMNSSNAIYLYNGVTSTIQYNNVQGSTYGIYVSGDGNNTIAYNNITSGGLLVYGANNIVTDNIVNPGTVRSVIYISGNNNFIANNTVYVADKSGIRVEGGGNNTIIANTAIGTNKQGYGIVPLNGDTVQDNIVTNCNYGIWPFNAQRCTITGNNVTGCNYGLYVTGGSNHTIIGNIIKENSKGIRLTGTGTGASTGNMIYDNYFINNTNQTEGNPSNNNWNTTGGGNYWSDYTGDDLDGDGIGDTPYQGDQKPLIADLLIENITATSNSIQVRVKNNGKADITKIDPDATFPVNITCDSQEFIHEIPALQPGESRTITQNLNLTLGDYIIIANITYTDMHYLRNTNIRDANINNNVANTTVSLQRDLKVTNITYNPNNAAGHRELFANEPNTIQVTIYNEGNLDAGQFKVKLIVGEYNNTKILQGLAAGATANVTFNDFTPLTGPITINVIVDSDDEVEETNETNNIYNTTATIYYNGYKGKQYTNGSDINTVLALEGRLKLLYSPGNSTYRGSGSGNWQNPYIVIWTPADLPIPEGATIKEARLYQPYTWNTVGGIPDFIATFNNVTINPLAHYNDTKGYGSSNYPSGLLVYNVTSLFRPSENNTLTLTAGTNTTTALYGSYILIIYEHENETIKKIWINEETDMLYSRTDYGVNDTEATAHAIFNDINTNMLKEAKTIVITASANEANKSKFYFNNQEYTGFWQDYLTGPQIGFSTYQIKETLQNGTNTAKIQSYNNGSHGDNMVALQAILILEYEPPMANFTANATEGIAPLTVQFTDLSTEATEWYWDFNNDTIIDSTEQNPTYTYTQPGTYTVTLIIKGPGGENTLTKENYITVYQGPQFTLENLTVIPTSGVAPLNITVSANLTNSGDVAGNYTAQLKVNGQTVATKTIAVPAGQTVSVEFSRVLTAGVYNVTIDDLAPVAVTVLKPANITVGNLTVTPKSGVAPLNITVTANLRNTGDLAGNYTAQFKVNGQTVATKTIAVPAGGVGVVSFNYTLTSAGNYPVAINNLTAFVSVRSPGISVGQIIDAASWVRAYYERYGRLPSKVAINGQQQSMAQFLYLLCKATVNINAGNLALISVKSVASPTASSGWYRHGRIYRSSYVKVAKNILSFIDSRGRAPNYAITGLGRIPFQRLVYMYSKIIKFYGTNKRLPNYVTI